MDLAACPSASRAPVRCEDRARRIGQVKFQVLQMPPEPEPPVTAPEPVSGARVNPFRALRAFLFRVVGRLAVARP